MSRVHVYSLVRETKTKIIHVSTAVVLAATSLTGALPFLFAQKALALTSAVTPLAMSGWTTSSSTGGQVKFVAAANAPLGTGAAQISTTSDNNSVARLSRPQNTPLADVSALSFQAKKVSGNNAAVDGALRVSINLNGTGTTVDDQLMYEPYFNGTVTSGAWQTWDAMHGTFWSNYAVSYNGLGGSNVGYATNFTLADVLHDYPNAKVVGLVLSLGTWNPSTQVLFDNFVFNSDTYDFEPATVQACSALGTTHVTSLAGWDTSETRSAGHNQVTTNGLHVWTDPSGGSYANEFSKAAAYYPVNFALADAGTPDITIAPGASGVLPSLQLGVDKDGNGTWDGYLVYEPSVYGTGNYWSSKDFGINSGMGYTSFGTLNDYLNANPNARVTSIGYSLGSGVVGDATITQLTAGCTSYVFGNQAPTLTVTAPAAASVTSTKTNGNKLRITGSFTDDVKANYATFQLVYQGNSVAIGTIYGYGSVYNPAATYAQADGSYAYDLAVPANLADGQYSLFYVGTDFNGNVTERLERVFTIDNTATTTPTITAPGARTWHKTAPIVDSWTTSSDAHGIATYQVAYAYDDGHSFSGSTCPGAVIGSTPVYCRDTTATSRNHSPSTSEQGGVTIWVRAFDTAGNASPWSSSVHYYYDISPATTTINVSTPQDAAGDVTFTVSGNASDNLALNRVYVQLINKQTSARYGGTTINLIPKGASASWSVDYSAIALGLPTGDYYAVATATDMAGNSTTTSFLLFTLPSPTPVDNGNGDNNNGNENNNPGNTDNNQNGDNNGAPTTTGTGGGSGQNQTPAPAAAVLAANTAVPNGANPVSTTADPATTDTNTDTSGEVLAATTAATDTNDSQADQKTADTTKGCGKILGLCWPWWIVIVVGIAVVIWVIRAAGKQDNSNK